MKKILSVLLAAVMLLGMMSFAVAEGGDPVVIQFYEHSDGEVTAQRQVEAFNAANPDIRVELHIIANDDYDDKIKVMMAGNADIDVLWLRSPGQGRNMYQQGALLGLNDLMAANGLTPETVSF